MLPNYCILDMIFVMDFSGGTLDKHNAYINISSAIIESLSLSRSTIQVGMVRYSGPGRADTVFHLNKHNSTKEAILDMKRADHMGGVTYTGQAIQYSIKEFNEEYGGRKQSKKIIIIFTDGYSQDPSLAAENATKLGIEIHAVAIDDELIKSHQKLQSQKFRIILFFLGRSILIIHLYPTLHNYSMNTCLFSISF
ncbi:unnamed protein product [Dracunculus medinensis]|uniref:VWFA domain-containing protein n=1 Tax=Dracunculus medinensis TaxID=318479 RepID=A0A3P7SKZ1_DRAME|nr:unnamed protein product [Dracunculus medinensis]